MYIIFNFSLKYRKKINLINLIKIIFSYNSTELSECKQKTTKSTKSAYLSKNKPTFFKETSQASFLGKLKTP